MFYVFWKGQFNFVLPIDSKSIGVLNQIFITYDAILLPQEHGPLFDYSLIFNGFFIRPKF